MISQQRTASTQVQASIFLTCIVNTANRAPVPDLAFLLFLSHMAAVWSLAPSLPVDSNLTQVKAKSLQGPTTSDLWSHLPLLTSLLTPIYLHQWLKHISKITSKLPHFRISAFASNSSLSDPFSKITFSSKASGINRLKIANQTPTTLHFLFAFPVIFFFSSIYHKLIQCTSFIYLFTISLLFLKYKLHKGGGRHFCPSAMDYLLPGTK